MTALVFDIEGHSTGERYLLPRDEYFRIGGLMPLDGSTGPEITDDQKLFRDTVDGANLAIGHNITAFDLPALGITDLLERAKSRRIIDTWTLATVMDTPPDSYQPREGKRRWIAGSPEKAKSYYALDNLAFQYGVGGKANDLRALAKQHGDPDGCCLFGTIPIDDVGSLDPYELQTPEQLASVEGAKQYRDYLRQDVVASRDLLGAMLAKFGHMTDYHWREQRVAAVLSTVSMNGFRLDKSLTQARIDHNAEIRQSNLSWMSEHFGLPTTKKDGKPSANPLATDAGKRAMLNALYSVGVQPGDIGKTDKNAPSLGKETMNSLMEKYSGNPAIEPVVDAIASVQGLRAVYQTSMDNVHADGFCHSDLFTLQASGRVSTQNPGLTVFGKRDGKYHERDIFVGDVLPDEDDDFHVLFAVDFSQIDARAVAVLSQDHLYMDMFNPGVDLHVENAIAAFGRQAYDLDPKSARQDSKAIGHGWNYGLGLEKLAEKVGMERAIAFREMMNHRYGRLVAWKQDCADEGAATGKIDNGFGRVMKVNPERAYTQGPALRGQGAARDLMFESILRMDHRAVRMIKALVHDELVFSAPRSIARDVQQHVIEAMSFEWAPAGASRPIAIEADASPFVLRWGQAYAA